jgi:hypothetical protein
MSVLGINRVQALWNAMVPFSLFRPDRFAAERYSIRFEGLTIPHKSHCPVSFRHYDAVNRRRRECSSLTSSERD